MRVALESQGIEMATTVSSDPLVGDDGTDAVYKLFGLDLVLQDDGEDPLTFLADGLGSVRVEMADEAIEAVTTYEPY